ncbi:hypothetical protein Nepgr_006798 [Nepenthes gracilis]|uniref:Uncharacterized protein n=1 Tax=Nepenthes gracilis TaxID=150966 RepID=A0AAD3S5S9_NEPGR|nr:hypothetical protein Nepgr_006798 [Nepenthes gracilis]
MNDPMWNLLSRIWIWKIDLCFSFFGVVLPTVECRIRMLSRFLMVGGWSRAIYDAVSGIDAGMRVSKLPLWELICNRAESFETHGRTLGTYMEDADPNTKHHMPLVSSLQASAKRGGNPLLEGSFATKQMKAPSYCSQETPKGRARAKPTPAKAACKNCRHNHQDIKLTPNS